MRFVSQSLGGGETSIVQGPSPQASAGHVTVRVAASLVSAGTERMLVDFGRANLVDKARQQPERVRDVLDKARTDGVLPTVEAVRGKLAQPITLGYASAGVVVDIGPGVTGLQAGDLVATNGPHAELVAVPSTLAAPVPDGVSPEEACFASVAAVGLQGIRLLAPQLGERFVVSGLGLIGLLAVQLLRANGCDVMGVDPNPDRRAIAATFGALVSDVDGADELAGQLSGGLGVDGVLVCASTTSSTVMRSAARMCRKRGRVILVGVAGLELDRAPFYERELTFQVSSAYGPGRYDPFYEAGTDYPFGLVRWTAGRNMQAVLDQIAAGRLDVTALTTHTFPFDDAPAAYDTLTRDPTALGIVLTYPDAETRPTAELLRRTVSPGGRAAATGAASGIAMIGAGNFAARTLAPAIAAAGSSIAIVATRSGTSAALLASTIGAQACSDVQALFDDPAITTVFVATRHDSHADLTAAALRAGKHVYVEKPLAVDPDQLAIVESAVAEAPELGVLTVGFNRRFAPFTTAMREALDSTPAPKALVITVNAGAVPVGHWTLDERAGGGRIIGEACHFIDLARHLVAAPIRDVRTRYLDSATGDTATVSLGFADGSTAEIHYLANGSAKYPKERIEVFGSGRVIVNENHRTLRFYGWPGKRTRRARRQDKGHAAAVAAFLAATRGERPPPIPLHEILDVSRATIAAARTA